MSKSEVQVLDFDKICRLCLLEKRSMSSIFSKKKSDKKVPLPVRIMSCASLELYEGDGLPSSICNKCLLSVNQSYAFREQCEQADTTLRQYAQRLQEASEEASTNREHGEIIDSLERNEDVGNKIPDGGDERNFKMEESGLDLKENYDDAEENEETEAEETSQGNADNCDLKTDAIDLGNVTEDVVVKKEDEYVEDEIDVEANVKIENVISVADVETVKTNARFSKKVDRRVVFPSNATKAQLVRNVKLENARLKRLTDRKLALLPKLAPRTAEKSGNAAKDQKHVQLLKNLMNNKNIIIKKTMQPKSDAEIPRKMLPNEARVARLWKEWEEINRRKRTPAAGSASAAAACSQLADFFANKPPNDLSVVIVSQGNEPKRKSIPPEVVFSETSAEKPETEDAGKMKWKNGKDTVYCKDCQIFMLRSSYHNHIKFVHEKIKKYLCQTCGYAACTGTILRQHVQAVHVGYSFYCDQCPKKFNLMKRLKKHVEVYHSGKPIERNHICQYCAMAFAKPGCLNRHLRSHTQETPYECQYCHRRFKYRWPKVQHERLHTGEKPYKCSFCDERFTQNCVRKSHEYKKHGNEEFKPKERTRKKKKVEKPEGGSSNASDNSESDAS